MDFLLFVLAPLGKWKPSERKRQIQKQCALSWKTKTNPPYFISEKSPDNFWRKELQLISIAFFTELYHDPIIRSCVEEVEWMVSCSYHSNFHTVACKFHRPNGLNWLPPMLFRVSHVLEQTGLQPMATGSRLVLYVAS